MKNYIDVIKENAINNVFTENENELIIRCPFCGDSRKNPNHAHCYVSKYTLPGYNSPMFYCQKCNTTGPVKKLIKQFGIIPSSVDIKSVKRIVPLQNTLEFYRKFDNGPKIDYIRNRLQLDEIPQWIDNTIVDTIIVKDKPLFTNFLKRNYIGFKSFDNTRVNARRTVNNPNFKRYITLRKNTSEYDFYIAIPQEVSFLSKGTIILAEGVFSALRGYLSLLNLGYISKRQQVIIVASWSKNSLNTCVKYLFSRLGIVNWNIVLLADKDLKINKFNLQFACTALYNKRHLDFGETCNDIKSVVCTNDLIRRKIL